MSKLDYFLLCESVLVDKADRISLINLFEVLHVAALPGTYNKFVFTFRIIPDAKLLALKKATFTLTIDGPDGKQYFKAEGAADIASHAKKTGKSKIASSLDISGFPITQTGTHIAKLFLNGEKLGDRTFEVVLQDNKKEQ